MLTAAALLLVVQFLHPSILALSSEEAKPFKLQVCEGAGSMQDAAPRS